MKVLSREDGEKRTDQVLRLAASGYTDKQIALELGVSVNTIESYWKRIREMYSAPSRTAAVIDHFMSKIEAGNEALLESQRLLKKAYESRGEKLSIMVGDTQKRLRESKRRDHELALFERASVCSASFAYEVEPTNPFRCRYISQSASQFGIDVRAIRLDEINFWDCVYEPDVATLFELTLNSPFMPETRYVHTYRLKTPEPRWIIDSHQCIYGEDGRLVTFAGFVMDAEPLVQAGGMVPEVRRILVPAMNPPISVSDDPSSHSINPLGSP